MTVTIASNTAASVFAKIEDLADVFSANADLSEDMGRLSDATAQALKQTGVMRMLQPREFGGMETHPCDYLKAVLEIGVRDGSAGWVSGVVGVHPHELAHGHRQMQEEVWGQDPDTWVASPYAPFGRAVPTEGGYRFTGRWSYSSGTDHCQWVMIGGLIADEDGTVTDPVVKHFVLPRGDYEIVEGSWDVMGLKGTGSKDLVARSVFVPWYRVIDTVGITEGTGGHDPSRQENPLYRMPRNIMFSGVITGGTLALAKGTLVAFIAYAQNRESRMGKASTDPVLLATLGAAAADIDVSILSLLHDTERIYDICAAGRIPTLEERAEVRRNQVRASHRAVAAADSIFKIAGGHAIYRVSSLQRHWRDAQTALHHVSNQEAPIYNAWGLNLFGHPVPAAVKI